MSVPGDRNRGRVALALVGVLLLAANMRGALTTVSPISELVSVEIGLDAVALTVIGMLPTLAFAVSGLLTSLLAARIGVQRAVVIAVVLMAVGQVGRAVAPNLGTFVLSAVVLLAGIGIANVLLPPAIKLYFPSRIAFVTAVSAGVMSIGTALPAVAVYPVADAFGWRVSLGVWALLAVAALPPWIALAVSRRTSPVDVVVVAPRGRVARSGIAGKLLLIYATMAVNLYAVYTWLPAIVGELGGVDPATGGSLLGLFSIMGLVASVVVGVLAPRLRSPALLIPPAIALLLVGYTGIIVLPHLAPLWVIAFGLCPPTLFQVTLMLIGLLTRTELTSVSVSAYVQGLGFGIGALGPLAFGALHAVTGSWVVPLVVFGMLSLGAVGAAWSLRTGGMVDDELAEPA